MLNLLLSFSADRMLWLYAVHENTLINKVSVQMFIILNVWFVLIKTNTKPAVS